jgi:Flp pilus assembly protein TadG
MVLLALLLPVLLGAMALGTDIAIFYFQWGNLQRAADAAALAGASKLPLDPDGAKTVARNYAGRNGIAAGEVSSVTVAADNRSITVVLTRNVPYYFGAVLGLSQSPVSARGTAGLVPTGGVTGAMPIGLDSRTTYTFGQQVMLMQGDVNSRWGPGNWGALALGGGGASNFASNVSDGYPGEINLGDLLTTETGKMTGQVRGSFSDRISSAAVIDPGGTFTNHALDNPRVVTVPIVNFAGVSGNSQVPVTGFAEVWLQSIDAQLNLTVIFIQQITPGGKPNPGGPDTGAYKVVLLS